MKILGLLLFFYSASAFGSNLRANLHSSVQGADVSARVNSSLVLGVDAFSLGGFVLVDVPNSYTTDQAAGLALRTGKDLFFELGAGIYKRKFESLSADGVAGFLLLGKEFGSGFNLALNLTVKQITSGGLEKRTMADLYPTLGWGISL